MTPMAACAALAALLAQDPSEALAGHWINAPESVIVLIAPCSDAGWCGSVQWASDKAKADAARRGTKALIGTELFHGFMQVGPGRWRGRLFVPDLNKTPKAELRQLGPDRLQVRGCAVGRLLCRTQSWTRAAPR